MPPFDASVVDNEQHHCLTYREDHNAHTHTQYGRNIMTCTSPFFDHG